MKINVWPTSNGYRADPPQLSGTPPNGTGATADEAVASLVRQLRQVPYDSGHGRQMKAAHWPEIEVVKLEKGP